MDNIKEIIEKHLGFQGGTNDKWWLQSSIEHYKKGGKPTGSFYQAIEDCMKDYARLYSSPKEPEAVHGNEAEKKVCEGSPCFGCDENCEGWINGECTY